MKKYTTIVLTLLAIVTCFGLWHHMDTIQQKISIHMNQNIQIDQSEIASEYIASTSVGVENIPEDAQNEYKLGIEVKLYDNANCENEITNIADYEIQDETNIMNGTNPVKVKIKIKENTLTYDELHVVMSAQLEKKNI